MARRSSVFLLTACLACVSTWAGAAWAAPAWNPLGGDAIPLSAPSLLPLAQAEPAPSPPEAVTPVEAAAPNSPPQGAASQAPPPVDPTPPVEAKTGNTVKVTVCDGDAECPDQTICENNTCRRIERRVNVFYLYYQEGSFREILGVYWSKRGSTGYRVVAPFYWNYFSPKSRSLVVAPFYWHFEDDAAQRTSTVIVPGLPISWSRQPGARSFGVWPLFYLSTKFGWAAPLLGSFKVADPDKGRALGAVAFLYWWQRTPESSFDLGFPLFVSTRSPASAFTFALPLNFYWRRGDDARTLALPFFYHHAWKDGSAAYTWLGYSERQGRQSSGSILWLYWFGRDRARETAHDVVFPLLWSFRSKNSGTSVFFPLVWDFRGRDTRLTIAVPVVHLRDGTGWLNVVFPLWWSGGDAGGPAASTDGGTPKDKAGKGAKAWRFQTLFPLFFWKQSEDGARFSWVALIGGYSRDHQAQSRTLGLLPGLFFRRDPDRAIDVVTPLYVRHTDKGADATTRLIALLLYLRDDPGGSTKVLFPVFWRFSDRPSNSAATALFPLFFHRSGPRDSLTAAGVFPLWFYRRQWADGGWGAGLFPLAFFGRRGEGGHAVVFPLLWRFADAKSSVTTLLPLFFTRKDEGGRDSGIFPLLTFFGHREGRSYQVQFPLFWRFADERAHTATTVTPLGFFGRSPQGWRAGVGPLLPIVWIAGGGPQRHFVLFPLLWHFADDKRDETTTVVANFMHRRRGGETTDALFPLIYYRRGARPGGSDETSFTLLPFVHYRRDAFTRLLITPIGAAVNGPRRAAGFLGPYLWYRGQRVRAQGVPFLYADITRADTQERTRQFGPVFAIDGPRHRARVVFPLFGRYVDDLETDTYVFPSFFRQRKSDGYSVDTLLPLYWHSRWRGRTTTVIGPWYRRQGPAADGQAVHNTGLAPLYFWAKNAERTVLVMPFLLTFHRHDFKNNTVLTWVGPVFRTQSKDNARTVVFPLWWSGRDGQRRHRVLLPLYWHFADVRPGAAPSAWSLLLPFYWSTEGTARTRALLPLAWYTRDPVKKTGSEAVLPFFYASHGPDQFSLFTLIAGYSGSPTLRRWYVLPIYVSDSPDSSTRVVAPLYFSHFNKASETRTRLVPPLLHFSRSTPEKSISTMLALFWRRTDVASATTLGLPLYFDIHDYRQSRTTVFAPVLLRHANEITGHTYWLAPLFYRHSTPTGSSTVGFPLFWDWKGKDRRTTIFIPFFAHWTRPTHSGTYVFPIFYYRKGFAAGTPAGTPDGTWRLFIPPLFDAAVQRPGDMRWEILGGLFGKERIGRNHYLKVFFFSFETQKAAPAQTSWYGQPRRISRARPVRGLATNAW